MLSCSGAVPVGLLLNLSRKAICPKSGQPSPRALALATALPGSSLRRIQPIHRRQELLIGLKRHPGHQGITGLNRHRWPWPLATMIGKALEEEWRNCCGCDLQGPDRPNNRAKSWAGRRHALRSNTCIPRLCILLRHLASVIRRPSLLSLSSAPRPRTRRACCEVSPRCLYPTTCKHTQDVRQRGSTSFSTAGPMPMCLQHCHQNPTG